MFLTTLDKSSEIVIILEIFFTSFYNTIFISSLTDRPQICFYPRTGYWAIGPALFHVNSTYGVNWPP